MSLTLPLRSMVAAAALVLVAAPVAGAQQGPVADPDEDGVFEPAPAPESSDDGVMTIQPADEGVATTQAEDDEGAPVAAVVGGIALTAAVAGAVVVVRRRPNRPAAAA